MNSLHSSFNLSFNLLILITALTAYSVLAGVPDEREKTKEVRKPQTPTLTVITEKQPLTELSCG